MKFINTLIAFSFHIKTKPTRRFILIIFALFGLFIQAYMHNYNIVYIILFFIFSVALTACFLGRLNLFWLDVTFLHAKRAFATLPFSYTLSLSNDSQSETYALTLGDQEIITIASKEKSLVTLHHTFERRGEKKLEKIELSSTFPFAHVIFSKTFQLDTPIMVYPTPKGESLEKRFFREIHFTGEKEEFDGLRTHNEGDTLSDIHWASVAKGEKLSKNSPIQKKIKPSIFTLIKQEKRKRRDSPNSPSGLLKRRNGESGLWCICPQEDWIL